MIDLHAHLLPGLDDGPESLEIAEEMARLAVEDGITTIVATPHSGPGEERADPGRIHAALAELRGRLDARGIPLQVHSGEEVVISTDLVEQLQSGRVLPLGDGPWVLVELPFNQVPIFAESVLFKLRTAGYRPLLAHPERNLEIQRNRQIAVRLAGHGVGLQLDVMSLLGDFGTETAKTSEFLLRAGVVHVIGSDGHSPRSRPIRLSRARDYVVRFVGREGAMRLVHGNPEAILAGKSVQPVEPGVEARKRGFFARIFQTSP